jgi:hypothetical protein
MASTSIWSVKGWLGKVVIYVENPDKTENPEFYKKQDITDRDAQGLSDVINYATETEKTQKHDDENTEILKNFVSGVNCTPATARDEMMAVKKRYGKENGIVAFHGYQSFAPGEATPEMAHEIGIKLAQRLWGDRFQVIVATHLDKDSHLHNHFVLNSVSYTDGKRYYRSKKDYRNMQIESDKLCREYKLSVIDNPQYKSKHYGEWRAEKEGRPTLRGFVKSDVDKAIEQSMTEKQFFDNLRRQGYEIKQGKDISIRPPGKDYSLRLFRNFGEDYSIEGIRKRILAQNRPKLPSLAEAETLKIYRYAGTLKTVKKVTGLRALYLHYCYKMGILPKRKQSARQVHFLFREDIIHMQNITRETRLLAVHHIDTNEQLFSYKSTLGQEIESLTESRKHLRYKSRSIKDEVKLSEVKTEISVLSKKLNALRKEVRLCDGIAARSGLIKDKLKAVAQSEISVRKEKNEHEQFGRRGRTNR